MKLSSYVSKLRAQGLTIAIVKAAKHFSGSETKKRLYVREVAFIKDKVARSRFRIDGSTPLDVVSDNIWVCWLQGEDKMPGVVRLCYDSIRNQAGRHKVVLVTFDNYRQHCTMPARIEELCAAGRLMPANFADMLRINLLAQRGGLWLDATIFAASPIPEEYFTRPFFSMKFQPDSYEISHRRWVSYCLGRGREDDPVFAKLVSFFDDYTDRYDEFWDYFLIDYALDYLYDTDEVARRAIDDVPKNNTKTTRLLPALCSRYEESSFGEMTEGTVLFKLRYRPDEESTADLMGDGDTVFCHMCRMVYDGKIPL